MGENGGGEYKDETVRHSFSATINSLLCDFYCVEFQFIKLLERAEKQQKKKKRWALKTSKLICEGYWALNDFSRKDYRKIRRVN